MWQQNESYFHISWPPHATDVFSELSATLLNWLSSINFAKPIHTHTHNSVALLSEYNKRANNVFVKFVFAHPSFLAHLHIIHLNKSLCWRVSLSCKPLVWLKLILTAQFGKSPSTQMYVCVCVVLSVYTVHGWYLILGLRRINRICNTIHISPNICFFRKTKRKNKPEKHKIKMCINLCMNENK